MRPVPSASAVAVAMAAGCLLLSPASTPASRSAASGLPATAPAAAASQRAPRPTKIRGWNVVTRRVLAGTRLSDRIRVRTGGVGSRRSIRLLRARLGSSGWKSVWSGRTNPRGRLTVRFTAPDSGAWKYRIRVRATATARAKTSTNRRLVVWTPQPSTGTPDLAPSPPPPASRAESLVYVTGDIGQCGGAADKTAALIDQSSAVVVATGDLAYPNGTDLDFDNCYDPYYGGFKDTTFPVPGNHEYNSGATAYFTYFGSRVGTLAQPWYTIDIGGWRFFMLNSNCAQVGGCDAGSRQYTWLTAQLAGELPRCTAAVWHHPRWSSGVHGPDADTSQMYSLLAARGTDVLLTGHEHNYERFARMDSSGRADPAGVREFVVGTGGQALRDIPDVAQGSEVRLNDSHGVMQLHLADSGFRWRFEPTNPAGQTDAGSEDCS